MRGGHHESCVVELMSHAWWNSWVMCGEHNESCVMELMHELMPMAGVQQQRAVRAAAVRVSGELALCEHAP